MRIAIRRGLLGLALAVVVLPLAAADAGQLKEWLNKAPQPASTPPSTRLGSNLPESDIAAGLNEALAHGTTNTKTLNGVSQPAL